MIPSCIRLSTKVDLRSAKPSNMSENVGLSTPRGSGTSGYVQRNLAAMRPRDRAAPYPPKDMDSSYRQRQPDKGILEHERKREVEVKVLDLRDELEDQEVDEEEIDRRCDELRKKLLADLNSGKNVGGPRKFKEHQVHAMADAKIKESERLRKALKISKDYEEGSHWRKQEERLRDSLQQEEKVEEIEKTSEQRERRPEKRERGERSEDQEEGEVDESD